MATESPCSRSSATRFSARSVDPIQPHAPDIARDVSVHETGLGQPGTVEVGAVQASSRNYSAGASVNSSAPWGGPHGGREASRNGLASSNPVAGASPQAVRVPGRHRA